MRNKIIIIASAIVLIVAAVLGVLLLSGSNIEVSDKQIQDRTLYNEISNKAYKICFAHDTEQYKKIEQPIEAKEVKKQLQYDLTVCKLLEEKRILLDRGETDNIAMAEFEAMKTDPSQESFKNALFKVLKQENISEQRYLELASDIAYYKYNTLTLKNDFYHTEFDSESEKSLEEQFEKYVKRHM